MKTLRQSRREFLATSSSFAAAGLCAGMSGSHTLHAMPVRSRLPVNAIGPESLDPGTLRQLARRAIEVATAAGADYTDVRVADMRTITMMIMYGRPLGEMGFEYMYGIRTLIDGMWAFGYGTEPTIDGITRAAERTVARAKILKNRSQFKITLPKIPVARGEWSTPFEIDPFSISPDELAFMCGAYDELGRRVMGGGTGLTLKWTKESRVFASSEGTEVTQNLLLAEPNARNVGEIGSQIVMFPYPKITPSSAGFEAVVGTELQEQFKQFTEESLRLLAYPIRDTDVGRFEAVLDGQMMGSIIGDTILPALSLDRIMGHQANESGTSFLSADESTLGQQRFSPELTLRSNRTLPSYGAAKWDDEGVEIEPFTLIQNGTVVDLVGTRTDINTLASWYAKNGKPTKLHGTAVAPDAAQEPRGGVPSLIIAPGRGKTLDDLIAGLENGVLARGVTGTNPNQQLTGGTVVPGMLFEVKKGKITRRLRNAIIQFRTEALLKGITAMGDASSVQTVGTSEWVGQPGASRTQVLSSPAAHLTGVDIIQKPSYEGKLFAAGNG